MVFKHNTQDTDTFRPIGAAADQADAIVDDVPIRENAEDIETRQQDNPVEEIESLCLECGNNGITRLLLTVIPFFREVVIMSFRCNHCGNHNNEVQPASEIQPLGTTYTVKVTGPSDLSRTVVKSHYCSILIPEISLTIPPGRARMTTVEGVINDTILDLSRDQPVRQHTDPDVYKKLEELIEKLRGMRGYDDSLGNTGGENPSGEEEKKEREFIPFTIRLDDPSGNSFVAAETDLSDPKWSKRDYRRTHEQNIAIGLAPADSKDPNAAQKEETTKEAAFSRVADEERTDEILTFMDNCPSCGRQIETLMQNVNIAHFKDVFIMSTSCDDCGYRDNEIKSGGAISSQGRKITLKVVDSDDLSRDILKSETASFTVPEIELHLNEGTLGGRFTTLEGLLNQVYDELDTKSFVKGDSSLPGQKDVMEEFLQKMKSIMAVEREFTVVLDDPLANSYIQNLYAPDDDPNMKIEFYDRSWQQNEELGLNDMKVEGYEQPDSRSAPQQQ
ncbi:zf-ZPR1-domain-containing protein [Atractiella rhizophila]|nr:zf-ZPR1-domain-containing protein [Atractiella rhizophila]